MLKTLFLTLILIQMTACGNESSSSVNAIDHKAHPLVFELISFVPKGNSGEWEVEAQLRLWWGDKLSRQVYLYLDNLPTRTPDYKWPEHSSYKAISHDKRQAINKTFVLPPDKCFTGCTLNYGVYDVDGGLNGGDDTLQMGAIYANGSETEVLTKKQAETRDPKGYDIRYRFYRRSK